MSPVAIEAAKKFSKLAWDNREKIQLYGKMAWDNREQIQAYGKKAIEVAKPIAKPLVGLLTSTAVSALVSKRRNSSLKL